MHLGYLIDDPGWNMIYIFLGAGCDCEEDRCWCTILTAPRKGHLMYFHIKPWRSWSPSQQWDNSKTCQPVCCMTGHSATTRTSTQVEPTLVTGRSFSGAPGELRQTLPSPTALPVRSLLGRHGLPSTGVPGPTLLSHGGSARSTEGMVAPSEMHH